MTGFNGTGTGTGRIGPATGFYGTGSGTSALEPATNFNGTGTGAIRTAWLRFHRFGLIRFA